LLAVLYTLCIQCGNLRATALEKIYGLALLGVRKKAAWCGVPITSSVI
jgi:hypothetical protein